MGLRLHLGYGVQLGHPPVQERCGEEPAEGYQDGQGARAHGLQGGVEGAGLIQYGKEKSKGNLTAACSYLKGSYKN